MGKNNHKGPTQMNLYLRIVVGGYLVYLAYDIFKLRDTQAAEYWVMMLFVLLFTVAGAVFAAISIKSLIKKEYYDPNNDSGESEQIIDASSEDIAVGEPAAAEPEEEAVDGGNADTAQEEKENGGE